MKRTFVLMVAAILFTLSLLHQPAYAAFSGYVGLGGIIQSDPRCTSRMMGEVICAVLGVNQGLFVNRTVNSGSTWSGYVALGGTFVRNPSCTDDNAGTVICAAVDTNNALNINRTGNGSAWSGFLPLPVPGGVSFSSEPSCANRGTGEVICAVLGTNQELFVTRTVNSGITWSAPALPLGVVSGTFVRNPSCTDDNNGSVICAVVGTDNALNIIRTSNGSAWSGPVKLGGIIVGDPSCTSRGAREVICAVLGTDHALYVNRTTDAGVSWGGFQSLGGMIARNPSCTSDLAGGSSVPWSASIATFTSLAQPTASTIAAIRLWAELFRQIQIARSGAQEL